MTRLLLISAALLGLAAGCGSAKKSPPTMVLDGGNLPGTFLHTEGLSHNHLPTCDDPGCGDGAMPPLGGDHCPVWLNCRVFDTAQPKCSWIHNLEHGHIVLAYNCSNCDATIQAMKDFSAAHMPSLVTPFPELNSKVAVIVWGYGWVGDDFNADAAMQVIAHQDQEAPEPGLACDP